MATATSVPAPKTVPRRSTKTLTKPTAAPSRLGPIQRAEPHARRAGDRGGAGTGSARYEVTVPGMPRRRGGHAVAAATVARRWVAAHRLRCRRRRGCPGRGRRRLAEAPEIRQRRPSRSRRGRRAARPPPGTRPAAASWPRRPPSPTLSYHLPAPVAGQPESAVGRVEWVQGFDLWSQSWTRRRTVDRPRQPVPDDPGGCCRTPRRRCRRRGRAGLGDPDDPTPCRLTARTRGPAPQPRGGSAAGRGGSG